MAVEDWVKLEREYGESKIDKIDEEAELPTDNMNKR
jgi:hypothetical protein